MEVDYPKQLHVLLVGCRQEGNNFLLNLGVVKESVVELRRVHEDEFPYHENTLKKSDPQVKVHQIPLTYVTRPGNEDGTLHFAVEWENKSCGNVVMQFKGD